MTINGPAPIMLAFFMNTAMDQQTGEASSPEEKRPPAGLGGANRA